MMRQGIDLKVTGRVHDIKVPDRGPKVLVIQVNHGKDKEGKFRPSSFFDIKVFPSKDDLLMSVRPVKGDTIEAIAWGSTSEWVNKDGIKQRKMEWALSHMEMKERATERATRTQARVVDDDDNIPF
jgi:hypothetical protein